MPTHVKANKLGLTHKGSIGISTATIPDVCKTPSPGGPVPIPYPNIAFVKNLAKGTKTVKIKGKMIANKGSEYSMSVGDEPGTAGGVKSSTFKKETAWITYSFDVKVDGKNACRHTDKKFHNHKNTVDLGGNKDPAPGGDGPSKKECNTAIKLLEQPERLAAKNNKKLSDQRKAELRRKVNDGSITSNDLPGSIQKEFPGKLKGKSLNQVREECGKSRG